MAREEQRNGQQRRSKTRSNGEDFGGISKKQPHSIEAERALLAACMRENATEIITDCINAKIDVESFFRPAHKNMYGALITLNSEGIEIDEITLEEKLHTLGLLDETGGRSYINEVSESVGSTAFAANWIEIVKAKSLLRQLIRLSNETMERCYEGQDDITAFLSEVESEIFRIGETQVTDSAQEIGKPLENVIKMINDILAKRHSSYGTRSGFADLDRLTFGFHAGEMIVLAARPSVGKTSLAMNIAENVAIGDSRNPDPKTVLVFSLEMSSESLAQRILCSRAGVNMNKLRDGFSSRDEQQAIVEAAKEIGQSKIVVDDQGNLNILEVRAKARRVSARSKDLGLVIVDYLQLVAGMDNRASRENQIAEISRGMKAMAKELKVPVLVLSQLNRESEKEKRDPRMSDLRESGSIEQDADVVMLLHRPRREDQEENERPDDIEKIRLILAKQRNGPTGVIDLAFLRKFTKFADHIEANQVGAGEFG
ncbi:MAG: replicative DNA helicase [Verrucomicrobiota bacterium]